MTRIKTRGVLTAKTSGISNSPAPRGFSFMDVFWYCIEKLRGFKKPDLVEVMKSVHLT